MFPELLRLGSVVITTKSIFSIIAFLTTAFVFWRKSREEHYHEEQVFDAFLVSFLVGLIAARLGFIAFHFGEFSAQIWRVFDLVGKPGSMLELGLLGASLYLFRYAKQKKWDAFEVLDFWFLSVAAGLIFVSIGNFFSGEGFGNETSLPWGMVFPGVFQKHHPLQLYAVIFFSVLHWYLGWVEYHYRTFTWYRAGKKTAQTGFLTSIFLIAIGAYSLLMLFLRPSSNLVGFIPIDAIGAGAVLVIGLLILYTRSGHSISLWHRKESNPIAPYK